EASRLAIRFGGLTVALFPRQCDAPVQGGGGVPRFHLEHPVERRDRLIELPNLVQCLAEIRQQHGTFGPKRQRGPDEGNGLPWVSPYQFVGDGLVEPEIARPASLGFS